jgi:ParB family chromosome partitioning protein
LQKHQYRELDTPDNMDAEPPCDHTKAAIVVYGKGAGRSITVCTETNCPVHNPHVVARRAEEQAAHPEPVMAPAPQGETEEEAAGREAEYERQRKEHEAQQQRREEERKRQFEREQKEYEAEQTRREKQRKARVVTFERIIDHAPATFTAAQLRVFLRALINLDPYDFAEDVAAYFVGSDENNQQTPEEVLASTLASLPDEELTGFALRLALTGHTDIPRENDFDLLAEAESVFVPHQPRKKPTAKKAETAKPTAAKPEAAPKKTVKKAAITRKQIAA